MLYLVLFLSGVCFGSFVNCLVYRSNHSLSFVAGRSFCPSCRHKIGWFDNVPLLSFLFLRGKCRHCKKKIAVHYPLVELAGGLLFLICGLTKIKFNLALPYPVLLIFTFILFTSIVSDILYMTIPLFPVIFGYAVGSVYFILFEPSLFFGRMIVSLSMGLLFLMIYLLTRGRGMGFGDVYLSAFIGLILGFPRGLMAIYFAFVIGGLFGSVLLLLKKKKLKSRIAFGPFLVISATTFMLFPDLGFAVLRLFGLN